MADGNAPAPAQSGDAGRPDPAAAAPAAAAAAATNDYMALLGQIVLLMSQSAAHRHMFIADLDWLVGPPVRLRQMRIWRRDNRPVAYASWAFIDEAVEQRLMKGIVKLSPAEWKSGDRAWLIDLVAPHGGAEQAIKELRETVHANRRLRTLVRAPDGQGMIVKDIIGISISGEATGSASETAAAATA